MIHLSHYSRQLILIIFNVTFQHNKCPSSWPLQIHRFHLKLSLFIFTTFLTICHAYYHFRFIILSILPLSSPLSRVISSCLLQQDLFLTQVTQLSYLHNCEISYFNLCSMGTSQILKYILCIIESFAFKCFTSLLHFFSQAPLVLVKTLQRKVRKLYHFFIFFIGLIIP